MGKENKPSIYSDRGTIGSSSELDEYGVWVKSEPQDLSSMQQDISLAANGTEDSSYDESFDEDFPDFGSLSDLDDISDESSSDMLDIMSDDNLETDTLSSDSLLNDDFELPDLGSGFDDPEDLENSMEFDEEVNEEAGEVTESEEYTQISLEDFIGVSVPPSRDPSESEEDSSDLIDFDDLPDEQDIIFSNDPEPEAEDGDPASGPGGSDLSTQLLMRIAEELSSIRQELTSLKKDFSNISTSTQIMPEDSSFLEKEDDEKIALTGDELNNILITADFTEETGADANFEISEDLDSEGLELDSEISEDFSSIEPLPEPVDVDDIGDEMEISTDMNISQDMNISADSLDIEPLEFNEDDTFADLEINELLPDEEEEPILAIEDEMEAFTPSQDETEYLESEQQPDLSEPGQEELLELEEIAGEPDELEELEEIEEIETSMDMDISQDMNISADPMDFSEAVIDEPDLSSEIQENPIEEPSLDDISLSMDLSDSMELDLEETDSLELTSEDPDPIDALEEDDLLELGSLEEAEPLEMSLEDSNELELEELSLDESEPLAESLLDRESLESLDSIEEVSDDMVLDESFSPLPEAIIGESEEELPPLEDLDFLEAGSDAALADSDAALADVELEDLPVDELEDLPVEELEDLPVEELEDLPVELDSMEEHDLPLDLEDLDDLQPEDGISTGAGDTQAIPLHLKEELRSVLSYMDQLLEALPDEKIEEFARSEHYDTYKKLFKELGLV